MVGVMVDRRFFFGALVGAGAFYAWNRWVKNVPSTKG